MITLPRPTRQVVPEPTHEVVRRHRGSPTGEGVPLLILEESPAVSVMAAVIDHVGRQPTRSELTAARRAAHRLAEVGQLEALTGKHGRLPT